MNFLDFFHQLIFENIYNKDQDFLMSLLCHGKFSHNSLCAFYT